MKGKGRKNKDKKKQRNDASYSEYVRAKWFCFVFKLDFIQLMCKASLIFKSNLGRTAATTTVCSYHVIYTFQSESTLYSCLNVNGLLVHEMNA